MIINFHPSIYLCVIHTGVAIKSLSAGLHCTTTAFTQNPQTPYVLKLHYDFYFSSQPALCAETSPATLFRDSKWDVQQLLPFAPTSSPPPSWHTGSKRRLSSCGHKWCQRLSTRHCNSSAIWMNTWRACWTPCSESDTMWKVTFVKEVFIEFHHVDIYML